MPSFHTESSAIISDTTHTLPLKQGPLLNTPPQPHPALLLNSRNPSSSEETNSEENSSERNPSNRSMSSIATSFESVENHAGSKFFDHSLDNSSIAPNIHFNGRVNTTTLSNAGVALKPNFPFPQTIDLISVPTDSSTDSISTSKDHHQSKYVQRSPKRAISASSSLSSISSHRLVAKVSASSLSQHRNFSTYRSPSPTSSPSVNPIDPQLDLTDSSLPGYGIAIDHPVSVNQTFSKPIAFLDSVDPLAILPVQEPQGSSGIRSLSSSQRIIQLPPPHSMRVAERNSTSSQLSTGSKTSLYIEDARSSSVHQSKPPMTIVRRRSLPPQQFATTQNLLPDERTVLYRERVITMRELKRQKRKEYEEDERVLIGNKVSEGHANYAAAYYMLTGIRVSVSRCNAKVDRDLTDNDFAARHKLAFDVRGNELIPSSRYDFKFKDYSPWVFRRLRALFKLDPADYLMSLTSKYIVSELSSPGKSGSFFYFSRDYRFIIKTIHHSEHKMLRKILKDYYNHVKNNPDTLISQFYGLHRVKLPFGRKIHFIVMNNLFPPHHDLHRTYDLKGSTLGREYVLRAGGPPKLNPVLKDLNWSVNNESLSLGPVKAHLFISQLERDVALLKRLNIMDYSLLVGIYDKTKSDTLRQSVYVFDPSKPGNHMNSADLRKAVNSTTPTVTSTLDMFAASFGQRDLVFYNDDGGFQATDCDNQPLPEIYYLGVIDCLTPYTFFKRVETFWKGMSNARITISAIPASEYGDRFFEFMKKAIYSRQKKGLNSRDRVETTVSKLSQPSGAMDQNGLSVVAESASQKTSSPLSTQVLNGSAV